VYYRCDDTIDLKKNESMSHISALIIAVFGPKDGDQFSNDAWRFQKNKARSNYYGHK
jgi:hypothetical protein